MRTKQISNRVKGRASHKLSETGTKVKLNSSVHEAYTQTNKWQINIKYIYMYQTGNVEINKR